MKSPVQPAQVAAILKFDEDGGVNLIITTCDMAGLRHRLWPDCRRSPRPASSAYVVRDPDTALSADWRHRQQRHLHRRHRLCSAEDAIAIGPLPPGPARAGRQSALSGWPRCDRQTPPRHRPLHNRNMSPIRNIGARGGLRRPHPRPANPRHPQARPANRPRQCLRLVDVRCAGRRAGGQPQDRADQGASTGHGH